MQVGTRGEGMHVGTVGDNCCVSVFVLGGMTGVVTLLFSDEVSLRLIEQFETGEKVSEMSFVGGELDGVERMVTFGDAGREDRGEWCLFLKGLAFLGTSTFSMSPTSIPKALAYW